MEMNDVLVVCNVLLCSAIALRLMLFRSPGSSYQWWAAWLAYLLILAYASVPFRFIFDHYAHANWSSVLVNSIFCTAVYRAKGNIARLFRVLRPDTPSKD